MGESRSEGAQLTALGSTRSQVVGMQRGKVAHEVVLRTGLGCQAVGSSAPTIVPSFHGPLWGCGWQLWDLPPTERSLVPGSPCARHVLISILHTFSHLHGQMFSICSLQRTLTIYYLNCQIRNYSNPHFESTETKAPRAKGSFKVKRQ